jgi:hypothetical protein
MEAAEVARVARAAAAAARAGRHNKRSRPRTCTKCSGRPAAIRSTSPRIAASRGRRRARMRNALPRRSASGRRRAAAQEARGPGGLGRARGAWPIYEAARVCAISESMHRMAIIASRERARRSAAPADGDSLGTRSDAFFTDNDSPNKEQATKTHQAPAAPRKRYDRRQRSNHAQTWCVVVLERPDRLLLLISSDVCVRDRDADTKKGRVLGYF